MAGGAGCAKADMGSSQPTTWSCGSRAAGQHLPAPARGSHYTDHPRVFELVSVSVPVSVF